MALDPESLFSAPPRASAPPREPRRGTKLTEAGLCVLCTSLRSRRETIARSACTTRLCGANDALWPGRVLEDDAIPVGIEERHATHVPVRIRRRHRRHAEVAHALHRRLPLGALRQVEHEQILVRRSRYD